MRACLCVLDSPAAGAQTQSTQQSCGWRPNAEYSTVLRPAPRLRAGGKERAPGYLAGQRVWGSHGNRSGCCRQSFSTACGWVASPRTQAREGPASVCSTVLRLAPKRRVSTVLLGPDSEPGVRNAPPGTWQGNEFGRVTESRSGCCRQSFSTTCGLVATPRTQAREGPASVYSTVLRLAPKRRVLNSPAAGAQTQSTQQSCSWRPDAEPGVRNAPPGTWQGNEFGRVMQSRSGCCRQSFSTACGLVATPRTQAR